MLHLALLADEGLVSIDLGSDIWVLIIFTLMVVILYKTAWKNVLAGLKAREERIRSDIAHAEQARAAAEASQKEYANQLADAEEKVRQIINKAAADAHKIADNINAAAQAEAEARKEKALADIEQARKDAMRQVYLEAGEIATEIASRILRRNINAADQQNLISEALDQLQKVG